jgi:hypothetical protein
MIGGMALNKSNRVRDRGESEAWCSREGGLFAQMGKS